MLVKDLLIQFFDAYLVRRSLEEALAFLSDDVISLGTGAQEIARNKEELRELMREEFECIPGGFRYEISDYCEKACTDQVCIVFCNVLTAMPDEAGGELTFRTRLTMSAVKEREGWKISSLHMSAPSDQQEGEEFFPIKYGRQAIGRMDAAAGRKLIELMISMLPGGIMGGYLEKGFPLYIINDTMLDYLGYTYDELVEATGEEMQKVIAPEDWDRVERTIYDSIEKTGEYDVQYRVVRKDGTRLWVDDKGRSITTEDGRKAMVSVMLDINDGVRLQERLKKEVLEDPLTGIYNRKGALTRIGQCLKEGRQGALFAMDIDNFKKLNDTYGHQTGDRMLIRLAEIIRANSRAQDVAARIGGDEFILFLPGCTLGSVLEKRAENICRSFREAGEEFDRAQLSVSMGIALSREKMELEELLKEADDRLYQVKKTGKGNFTPLAKIPFPV